MDHKQNMVCDSCRFFALILECTKSMEFSTCCSTPYVTLCSDGVPGALDQFESKTLQHPVVIHRDFLRFRPVSRIQKENAYLEQGPECAVLLFLNQLNRSRCRD